MAFGFGVSVVSSQNKTSQGTVAGTVLNDVPVGSLVVVIVAKDNSSTTSGDNGEITSVDDSAENTWTKVKERTNAGAAAAAITCSMWYSVLDNELLTNNVIRANFASNVAAKAIRAVSFTIGDGNGVEVVGTPQATEGDAADPAALTISGLDAAVEHLFIRGDAIEGTSAYTATSLWTDISAVGTTGGSANTNARARGEWRILTATSATSDPASTTDEDYASVVAAFKEVAGDFIGTGDIDGVPGDTEVSGEEVFDGTGAPTGEPGTVLAAGEQTFDATAAVASSAGVLAASGEEVFEGMGGLLGLAGMIVGAGDADFMAIASILGQPGTLDAQGEEVFESTAAIGGLAGVVAGQGDVEEEAAFVGTAALVGQAGIIAGMGQVIAAPAVVPIILGGAVTPSFVLPQPRTITGHGAIEGLAAVLDAEGSVIPAVEAHGALRGAVAVVAGQGVQILPVTGQANVQGLAAVLGGRARRETGDDETAMLIVLLEAA